MSEEQKPREETAQERHERHEKERQAHELRRAAMFAQWEAQEAQREAEEKQAIEDTVKEWTESIACNGCQAPFEARFIQVLGAKMGQRYCQKCLEEKEAADKKKQDEEARAARWRSWVKMVPEDYLDTEAERCEAELLRAGVKAIYTDGKVKRDLSIREAVDMILDWPDQGPALALIGETGRCKTRLMLQMLGRLHMAGQEVEFVNAASMADNVGEQFSQSASAGNAYLRRLETVRVLFIDDLGKGKLTDRGEESLYRLIEQRKAHKRRTFYSANCTGAQLEARMSADRGAPIVRRLREMAHAIAFIETKPKAPAR